MTEAERCWIAGDMDGALHHATAMLRHAPSADALLILSRIADERHGFADALALAQRAAALAPGDLRCAAQHAYAALRAGNVDLARDAARHAGALPGDDAEALDLIGVVYHGLNDYAASAAMLRRASAARPDDPRLLANLAAVLTLCGAIDDARAACRAALRIDPQSTRALAMLSEISPAAPHDNLVAPIEAAIARSPSPAEHLVLHHALAREREGLGDLAGAFAALHRGKDRLLARLPRPLHDDRAMFDALARLPAPTQRGAGGDRAIFIVGMPRSGTTVVERILSNCAGVFGMGESQAMPALLRRVTGSGASQLVDAAALEHHWARLPMAAIGTEYLRQAAALAPAAVRHVDKLPLNFLLVDAILAALPAARILWVHRDPIDTVAGNYRQMFEYQSGSYDYTLTLADTARFVAAAERMRARSIARHPASIHAVDLDAIVDHPEATARALLDFCGLPWRDGVTAIDRNPTPAGSASAAQVRVPIHGGHRARAARYRPFLADAIAILDRARD